MSIEEIEAAIPHRSPMLLLDRIESRTENSIVCVKTFHADEFFFQGHFPGQPIVPGVILCESCMQAGAILLSHVAPGGKGAVPLATRADNVKFKRMVTPGDSIEIHVTLNERVANAFFLTGQVKLQGKLAARLDFACTVHLPN
ncbi:3-hydroxyacyl-[acyl-carrier-protein] dehydratase FabZ [Roseimaritima multifibrata]|uniref:3-hydroxyacyl-[acyl-carrier-protein] dehydratase FabZ n=1 Tax=Roseimaritima multifibrata TaxID=1930274 RepID=A0A517MEY5_9BACT|nr:3-hydroxyacyl-ACP dehydratase FabZ [Roseimaritima multifibrata]QDS93416.1 3-hydroxyacyl-[acyl-carrier-protein] dehydratase FabZ [Roseimaritima multifibrata]